MRATVRALLIAGLALACLAPVAQMARAQSVSTQVVTVEQDRLFSETAFGQRVQRDHEARVQALSAENRRIEAALIAEEQALTDRRAEVEPSDFRALAEAFDDKVQRIRDEQDAKTAALTAVLERERQNFLRLSVPVLRLVMAERGASTLLDRRLVLISADTADITDAAIARIDLEFGDGADAPAAAPSDDAPAEDEAPDTTPLPDVPTSEPATSED